MIALPSETPYNKVARVTTGKKRVEETYEIEYYIEAITAGNQYLSLRQTIDWFPPPNTGRVLQIIL